MAKHGILVDSCIFVDFLRLASPSNDKLKNAISDSRVVLSPYVRLELLKGVSMEKLKKLSFLLDGFPSLPIDENQFTVAEQLLSRARKNGLSFGLVDYLIVLQAKHYNLLLFTHDKTMLKLAQNVGVKGY